MNARIVLNWIGLSALAIALGATPPASPPRPAARPAIAPAAPRARVQLGKAPQSSFTVNNKPYTIDPKAPAVKAVRAIAPQNFSPAARSKALADFTKTQLAGRKIDKAKLDHMYVGPFRPEFVWWAYYNWAMRDRAWWAWNNYAYFDAALWAEWMQDAEFAKLIADFKAANSQQTLGFIPAQYANQPPAVIYNDAYIQAIYNPVIYTHPSIIVDGSAGTQLGNLVEGAPRTFGDQERIIERVGDAVAGLQFISVPTGSIPTYQIEVKRDGDLYIFGSKKTPLTDGLDDAPKWQRVAALVAGNGIDAVYKRKVTAGENIRMHGVEWSIASDQIELFTPASQSAQATIRHVTGTLERMIKDKDGFLKSAPELNDYLEEAKAAAEGMMTGLGNIDDDRVIDCHYALASTEQMAATVAEQSKDPQLIHDEVAFVTELKQLRESLNEVDELRDPSAPDPAMAKTASELKSPDEADSAVLGIWDWENPDNGAKGTLNFNADGTCVVLRYLHGVVDESTSPWIRSGDSSAASYSLGTTAWHTLPTGEMSRTDRGKATQVTAKKREWGTFGESRIKVISASFGEPGHEADVTKRVLELYDLHQDILVSPKMMGVDPLAGKVKALDITYTLDGVQKSGRFAEGKALRWQDIAGSPAR